MSQVTYKYLFFKNPPGRHYGGVDQLSIKILIPLYIAELLESGKVTDSPDTDDISQPHLHLHEAL